jgi:hypothetical protein
MRQTPRTLFHLISALALCTAPSFGMVRIRATESGPAVDGVYVNGSGPFRFLLDTGSNTNLISKRLAQQLALKTTFQTSFASLGRERMALGSAANEISLDSLEAGGQELLVADLDAAPSSGLEGILGQTFLARFDYVLDLKHKQLSLGGDALPGKRLPFRILNGRAVVSTSLGQMVLDSGAGAVVISTARLDSASARTALVQSAAGSQSVIMKAERLIIAGRTVWRGDAIAVASPLGTGVDGLLPLRFFTAVYVCNSGGYVVFE